MSEEARRFLFDWENLVLAARISSTAKLVAFAMKTHADLDGTRVRPGTARLCVLCGVSYASVKRARQELLGAGLLELVRRGNRRKGHADLYRLIIAEDIMDRGVLRLPNEIADAAEKITEDRQSAEATRLQKRNQGSETTPKDQGSHTDPDTDQGSETSRGTGYRAHRRSESGLTDDPPPSQDDHSTKDDHPNSWQVTSQTRARSDEQQPKSTHVDSHARTCPKCTRELEPDGFCVRCSLVVAHA